jgi:hypothetical protein
VNVSGRLYHRRDDTKGQHSGGWVNMLALDDPRPTLVCCGPCDGARDLYRRLYYFTGAVVRPAEEKTRLKCRHDLIGVFTLLLYFVAESLPICRAQDPPDVLLFHESQPFNEAPVLFVSQSLGDRSLQVSASPGISEGATTRVLSQVIRELFSIQRHPHEVCVHVRDLISQKRFKVSSGSRYCRERHFTKSGTCAIADLSRSRS